MKIRYTIFLSLAVLLSILIPQNSKALTISPPILELTAPKGQVINQSFKVRNEETESFTFYIYAQKFIAAGEDGTPQFIQSEKGSVDLASWIKFSNDQVTFAAGEIKEISFTISIPQTATPGGHYAAIFLSTLPLDSIEPSLPQKIGKVGMLLLVKITGEISENAEIVDFNVAAEPLPGTTGQKNTEICFDCEPPVNTLDLSVNSLYFNVRVKNLGNVHIKPSGNVLIKNSNGVVIKELPVNIDSGNILPGQIRGFSTLWDLEDYVLENPDEKLTAKIGLSYGTAGKILTNSAEVYLSTYSYINSLNFYISEGNIHNLDLYVNPDIYNDQYDYRLLYGTNSNSLTGLGTMTNSNLEMSPGTDVIEQKINFYLADIAPDQKYYYQLAVYDNANNLIYRSFINNFTAKQGERRLTDDELLVLQPKPTFFGQLQDFVWVNKNLVFIALIMIGVNCVGLIVILAVLIRKR